MDYNQLKEMPRFWVQYSITFFSAVDKCQVFELLNDETISNEDLIFECLYEEDKIYCINLEFANNLFCGFSCSDAIMYMFTEEILVKIEEIITKYNKNIKDVTLSLECYDNSFSTRYYMETDIVGRAADIVHRIRPNIYFSVGKDGIRCFDELREVCMNLVDINIDDFKDYNKLVNQIKIEINKLMKNKIENYKEIILLRYAIKFVRKQIGQKKLKQ